MRRSDGTRPDLRPQLPWPTGKPFRILSIDGGGIRGIFPAKFLAECERLYLEGGCVGDQFDLLTGTSTGGIIALALSLGIPASAILDVYMQHGAAVFPPLGRDLLGLRAFGRMVWGLGHYRYARRPLESQLRKIFGTRRLGDAVRRLCIPSFDGFTEVNIFKTPHHADFKRDWCELMVTVALATAAAPTFFPVYTSLGRHFGDGGVWANNPVMVGLVDALTCYALDRRQVQILSIGCGDVEMTMTKKQIARGGLWHWRKIMDSAMHLQSQNALGQAGLLIGRDQLLRVNAPAQAGAPIDMDDFQRAHDELPEQACRAAEQEGRRVREQFLTGGADPFPAYYGPRADS